MKAELAGLLVLVGCSVAAGCSLALDFGPSVLRPALDAGPDRTESDASRADAMGTSEVPGDASMEDDAQAADAGGTDPWGCGGHGIGGQPCCAAARCNGGFVCLSATCARCGGSREVCCPGERCDANRECDRGLCR
ncbi:MAG: hypothetical protein Q8S73_31295 [Deltaproteobacteria bacterium]|nr:hypothetical protein [Deltaproteobacteria bacterium]